MSMALRTLAPAAGLLALWGCVVARAANPVKPPPARKSGADVPQPSDKQLRDAVQRGDTARARALLERGARPNGGRSLERPLIEAVSRAYHASEMVRLLLDHGAEVDALNERGQSALLVAAGSGRANWDRDGAGQAEMIRCINLLLKHGASIDRVDADGMTALDLAMMLPTRPGIIRALVAGGARLPEHGKSGAEPLHFAACAGDTALVRRLLADGAPVNAPGPYGRTPLILAADSAPIQTVQALLDAGAQVSTRDELGSTALLTAVESHSTDTALELLRRGASPNVHDDLNGYTPLLYAMMLSSMPRGRSQATNAECDAEARRIDGLIDAILRAGADLSAASRHGMTPLLTAIRMAVQPEGGRTDWVGVLLERGAKVNDPAAEQPALHAAIDAQRADLRLPERLIKAGADINAVGPSKQPVLMDALMAGDFGLVALLMRSGARVEGLDDARKTPLHWAAWFGRKDLVEAMLALGVDVDARDILGQTPLMLARKANHPEISALLLAKGAQLPQTVAAPRTAAGQLFKIPLAGTANQGDPVAYSLGKSSGTAVLLIRERGRNHAEVVRFGSVFNDPAAWSPGEWNNVQYQLGRGYYAAEAYGFSGIIKSRGQTYVGVRWYSPSASNEHQIVHMVFRLSLKPGVLILQLVRRDAPTGRLFLGHYSRLPLLTRSRNGELVLANDRGTFLYTPPVTWRQIGPAPKGSDSR